MTVPEARTGGQLVADHLAANEVPYLIGVPGHGILPFVDALVDEPAVEVIQVRHEQSAAHMADAYFRATGTPLAVFTSIGPGAVNTAVGIATAYVDSSAMVVFTGDVHTYMSGRGVLQEIDRQHDAGLTSMFGPITKRHWQISRPDQIPQALDTAFRLASSGRPGPTLISLPMDVQADAAEVDAKRRVALPAPPAADHRESERAVEMLMSAERPVILVGGGVVVANGADPLLALAERTGAAVVATYTGKGAFPEDHRQYAWYPGSKGTDVGNQACREADVMLAVGCRFADECTSSYVPGETFSFPETSLVQVDIDPYEIGKNYPAEVGIQADASSALTLMADLASERAVPERDAFLGRLDEARKAWFERLAAWTESTSMPMTTSRVLATLRSALPTDTTVVSAAGHAQAQVLQEFPMSVPRTNITAAGFSTMGFTVPGVLGAKLGRPDRAAVGICGDGDFLMSCQELATAAQIGLNVIFVVLNNHGWNSIRDLQSAAYGEARTIATEFHLRSGKSNPGPDLVALSTALGVPAVRAEDPASIGLEIGRALASDGPTLIEIPVQRAYPESAGPTSGWWDVPVPAYLTDRRAAYEETVAAVRHDPVRQSRVGV